MPSRPLYDVQGASKDGSDGPTASVKKGKSGGIGHQIYMQLMNGVSHMLPFVVGGGAVSQPGHCAA